MPRRTPDVRGVPRDDPLDRFTFRGPEPPPEPEPERNPYLRATRIAVAIGVIVAVVFVAPRLIGSGVRPTLTDTTAAQANGAAAPQTSATPGHGPAARPGTAPAGTSPAPRTSGSTAASGTSTAGGGASNAGGGTTAADYLNELLSLTNAARTQHGCAPVHVDAKLASAAQDHTTDMASHDTLSHTGSDGSTLPQRTQAAGYQGAVAENIARGYPTPVAVMTAWMNSSGHRANIVNCSYTAMGAGYAPGGWWTQVFGG